MTVCDQTAERPESLTSTIFSVAWDLLSILLASCPVSAMAFFKEGLSKLMGSSPARFWASSLKVGTKARGWKRGGFKH